MELLPVSRQLCPKTRRLGRCRSRSAKPFAQRANREDRHGFLRHVFSPMWRVESNGWQKAEREFFVSLGHVCDHFELPVPDVRGMAYPRNAGAALTRLNEHLEYRDGSRKCLIIRDDNHRATLAVRQRYNTGRCLYYIPVRPLWNIVRTASLQPLAELLMSVYAYLYRVARVPFYADEGEYLHTAYEMLLEWVLEADDENEEVKAEMDFRAAEMEQLMSAGKSIALDLRQEHWLENFRSNLDAFKGSEVQDMEIASLAEDFLNLYVAYPDKSLFENMRLDFFATDEEDVGIYGEMYISFYWSAFDHFYDSLFDMVNNEFQECGEMEEPTVIQIFDRPQTDADQIDFDFEKRLFTLIDRLCEIMQDRSAQYDYETPPTPEQTL